VEKGATIFSLPKYVVCPKCHTALAVSEKGVSCTACLAFYPRRSTVYFADVVDDSEKTYQQAIYEGADADVVMELPYSDQEGYRNFCLGLTELIRRRGINGYQFKAFKTREILDRVSPKAGERVLDIGSGDGSMVALLALRYGVQGTGIDISSLVIERSVQVNPWGFEYYQADAEQLPFANDTFDGVVSMDVLEHLPHPDRCIAEAARVLRPGGWALFYAVSQRDAYTWHWTQRRLTDDRIGVDNWAGHRWENFLQPDQARLWMVQVGFDRIRITPFHALITLILDERFTPFFEGMLKFPWLSEIVLSLAELADLPLTSRGFGNGFYLEGRKAAD
jgi:ubiquinone/menaquinone biosynthesis C-methylase UbiE